jgi:peptidoglycan/LPS O-acetylase OafA/YrhL
VAIAAVALFHFPTNPWVPGGFYGVGVFFVLSGFLITPGLFRGGRDGTLDRLDFARRRVWRLLPALLVFVVLLLVADAFFGHDPWFASNPLTGEPGAPVPFGLMFTGAAAALTYTYNQPLAWSAHMPPPFGHLWTLAVEGQFYVAVALLVPALARRSTRLLVAVTAGLIAVSFVAPWVAWGHDGARAWIYFSSIPRIQQLFAGALLGELWVLGMPQRIPAWLLEVGAAAGGATILYLVFATRAGPLKYLGAFAIVAVAGSMVVAHLADGRRRSVATRVLASRPLVWLGKRSYAVYLWHWPLANWTDLLPHVWGVPLGMGCSLVAAELSWRLVELPASRFARRRREAAAV